MFRKIKDLDEKYRICQEQMQSERTRLEGVPHLIVFSGKVPQCTMLMTVRSAKNADCIFGAVGYIHENVLRSAKKRFKDRCPVDRSIQT